MPEAEFVLSRFQRGWSEGSYKKDGTLLAQLAAAKPDTVVIELGGNNSSLSDASYRPNIDWVLAAAKASGARTILWLGPAAATKEPYKSNKEWTRSYQSQYLPQKGVIWYDNFPHTQSGHVDGVHFGGSVYNAWAPVLVEQIRNAQAASSSIGTALTGTTGKKYVLAGLGFLTGAFLLALVFKRLRRV
jgi:lysophospholipase L1-like esterase